MQKAKTLKLLLSSLGLALVMMVITAMTVSAMVEVVKTFVQPGEDAHVHVYAVAPIGSATFAFTVELDGAPAGDGVTLAETAINGELFSTLNLAQSSAHIVVFVNDDGDGFVPVNDLGRIVTLVIPLAGAPLDETFEITITAFPMLGVPFPTATGTITVGDAPTLCPDGDPCECADCVFFRDVYLPWRAWLSVLYPAHPGDLPAVVDQAAVAAAWEAWFAYEAYVAWRDWLISLDQWPYTPGGNNNDGGTPPNGGGAAPNDGGGTPNDD